MATTYTAISNFTSFAANKTMLGLWNGTGSGQVLRLYRIWLLNNQVVPVTGVLTHIELRRISAGSGGVAITPTIHDTTGTALHANVLCSTNMTVTPTDIFKRIVWSTDEPAANATCTMDEFECVPIFTCIWEVGYRDPNTEPLTIRENSGIALTNIGAIVGTVDVMFQFTVAAS
jgi:hypothetical protein